MDEAIKWYISQMPFFGTIAEFVNNLFPNLQPLGNFMDVEQQPMFENLAAVLIAAFIMMLLRMIFNLLGMYGLTKSHTFMDAFTNEKYGARLLSRIPIFKSKFLNGIFGLTDAWWASIPIAFSDFVVLILVNMAVDPFVEIITEFIQDIIPELSFQWAGVITFVCALVIVGLLYNLVYFLGNVISNMAGTGNIFTTLLSSKPIVRGLVVTIFPEIIKIVVQEAIIIGTVMMYLSKEPVDIVFAGVVLSFFAILFAKYLSDLLMGFIIGYYTITTRLKSFREIFIIIEEMSAIIFLLTVMVNEAGPQGIMESMLLKVPFIQFFASGVNPLSIGAINDMVFINEVLHAFLFFFIFCGMIRLIYLIPLDMTPAGIVVFGVFWWVKVSIVITFSGLLYYGAVLGFDLLPFLIKFGVVAAMIFISVCLCPPMAQHMIVLVILTPVYVSLCVTGVLKAWNLTGSHNVIGYALFMLGNIAIGWIAAIIRAVHAYVTKPIAAITRVGDSIF